MRRGSLPAPIIITDYYKKAYLKPLLNPSKSLITVKNENNYKKSLISFEIRDFNGAARQIRTADLILTN